MVWFLTFEARGLSTHCRISLSRNLHCLPILRAGISPHSAQRQRVRVETPSHLDTSAVVSNGSGRGNSTFSSHSTEKHRAVVYPKTDPTCARLRPFASFAFSLPSSGGACQGKADGRAEFSRWIRSEVHGLARGVIRPASGGALTRRRRDAEENMEERCEGRVSRHVNPRTELPR